MTLNELIKALGGLKQDTPFLPISCVAPFRPDRVEIEIMPGVRPVWYAATECLYARDTMGGSGDAEVYVFGPGISRLRRLLDIYPDGTIRTDVPVGNSSPDAASLEFRRQVFLEMIRSVRPPGGGSTCREYMKEVLGIAKEEGLL